jgi:hypothetical protein
VDLDLVNYHRVSVVGEEVFELLDADVGHPNVFH